MVLQNRTYGFEKLIIDYNNLKKPNLEPYMDVIRN